MSALPARDCYATRSLRNFPRWYFYSRACCVSRLVSFRWPVSSHPPPFLKKTPPRRYRTIVDLPIRTLYKGYFFSWSHPDSPCLAFYLPHIAICLLLLNIRSVQGNFSVSSHLSCPLLLIHLRISQVLPVVMHKHSVSFPLVPASAPTSPAAARINRMERPLGLPVTPQRIIRSQKTLYRSPVTPASTTSTPYTPLSLRSFSTNSGSTINTPDSALNFKRFPITHSTENETTVQLADKSLADIAANWRSRANQNGIKVATAEDSSFGDDEGAYMRSLK